MYMAAPVIVGATAAASLFEKISAVTGSVPDLLQGIGAVAEWAKGQEGLSYKGIYLTSEKYQAPVRATVD